VLNADAVDDRRELAADFGNAERRCILDGAGEWRVRTGDNRIIYEIRDDELLVLVLQVGHRDVHRRRG
jgi:mRNA interferase RelE/StbE